MSESDKFELVGEMNLIRDFDRDSNGDQSWSEQNESHFCLRWTGLEGREGTCLKGRAQGRMGPGKNGTSGTP